MSMHFPKDKLYTTITNVIHYFSQANNFNFLNSICEEFLDEGESKAFFLNKKKKRLTLSVTEQRANTIFPNLV